MQRKTRTRPESTHTELLKLGKCTLKDGIQKTNYITHINEVIQEPQTIEEMKIWRRILKN